MPTKDPTKRREQSRAWYRGGNDPNKREIYLLLSNTNRPKYVGQSINGRNRSKLHWQQRFRRKSPVAEWLRTLDRPPIVWILETVPYEDSKQAERYWIELLTAVPSVQLINICHGPVPGRNLGRKHTKTSKERMRSSQAEAHVRRRQGETNPAAKLTLEEVQAIKHATGSLRQVAAEFNVSWITVRNIRLGLSWRHVE